MSSPLVAPAALQSSREAMKRPVTQPTTAAATDPSTPALHATPSFNGITSAFISPNISRVAGKTIGKTVPGQKGPSNFVGGSTPQLGSLPTTFDSPSMLAMEPGGSSMGISLSGMGLTASALGGSNMGKVDDAERRRRLERVLTTVGHTAGRVSQEGVQRLARKLGMEMYSETTATHELMTLAGNAYAVDLLFQPNGSSVVDNVELHFHGLSDSVMQSAPEAARILHDQLKPTSKLRSVNVMLDRFAENLEKLQRLDKLSVAGSNCFEAIAGVHTSLERLYQHEIQIAKILVREQSPPSVDLTGLEVMCKKSGRPRMHARSRIGLSIEYWRHKYRLAADSDSGNSSTTRMDVDAPSDTMATTPGSGRDSPFYMLTLECEYSSAALYPPVRVTRDWLSPRITVPRDDAAESSDPPPTSDQLDWTDPPPPLIPTIDPDPSSSAAAETQSSQPRARFVANLEPPIKLPVSVALQIYASVGIDLSSDSTQMQAQQQTYDGLILGGERPGEYQTITSTFDTNGRKRQHEWKTRVYVARPEFGGEISSIPFAHPRQLLPILPILRQYALFETLLRSLGERKAEIDRLMSNGVPDETSGNDLNPGDELEALLGSSDTGAASEASPPPPPRILDVTLVQALPVPRLSVVLPASGGPCVFSIEVHPNGEINVGPGAKAKVAAVQPNDAEKKDPSAEAGNGDRRSKALAEALTVCQDLVLWAEWVRGKISGVD